MAETQPTQPVNAAPAPAVAPPTPPDIAVPAPAPVDVTSGTPQPNQATAIAGSMAPYLAKENEAAQKAADIANAPAIPPNAPHARLFNIIAAIGVGLSAAGTSIATHGKEGGAPEVQEVMGARQQQQQSKVAAQQAQRDAQIRQQQTIADTNARLANNVMLMATLPNELTKRDLDVQTEAQALQENKANFAAQHGGMSADEFTAALNGTGPATGTLGAQVNPFFKTTADQQFQAASKILGAEDQYVQALGKALADPNATPKELWTATQRVQQQQALQEKATDAQVKKDAAFQNSVVGKLSTPEALAAPGSQAAIQARIDDPSTSPLDKASLQLLLPKAAVAQANAENIKKQEARNTQVISQGDPDMAGKLLADRTLTLEELKSRQVTPEFITAAVNAAKKYDPKFSAPEAAAQAKIAGAPSNQQFFGNTDSLLIKGGTLDQLLEAGNHISQEDWQILNKTKNWADLTTGNSGISAYGMKAVGVADDFAKVIGGGAGTDTARATIMGAIDPKLSPSQRAASIDAARGVVESQRNGRIGTNPYLKLMYPDPATMAEVSGNAGTQPAGPAAAAATPSGKAVSLTAAMALPINKGKTEAEVRADIQAHGYQMEP
jgi:hypothetical protein